MAEVKGGIMRADGNMAKTSWNAIGAELGRKKRGILFTVSVMLLAISLVALAVMLSEQSAKSKRTAVSIMDIDRVSDQHANVEAELSRILSAHTEITVSGNTVRINESLPLPAQMAGDMQRFADFEAAYSDLNMTMDIANIKNGSFLIQPNGIAITHAGSNFYVTPQNNPESSGAVASYDIEVIYPPASVDGAAWESLSTVANGSADAAWVHVRVRDQSFAFLFDSYATIGKSSTSYLNMTQGGVLVGFVQFSPPGALAVQYAGNIGLKASVGLSNPVRVEANDTVSIIASANKTSRVRIA